MSLPANKVANIRQRVNRARNFPANTCPASRYLQFMAEDLLRYGRCWPIEEEPDDCAAVMLSVLESLWKTRTELARLKNE